MQRSELVKKIVFGDEVVTDKQYLSVDDVNDFIGDLEVTIDEILTDMKCKYGFSDLDSAQDKLKELSEYLW